MQQLWLRVPAYSFFKGMYNNLKSTFIKIQNMTQKKQRYLQTLQLAKSKNLISIQDTIVTKNKIEYIVTEYVSFYEILFKVSEMDLLKIFLSITKGYEEILQLIRKAINPQIASLKSFGFSLGINNIFINKNNQVKIFDIFQQKNIQQNFCSDVTRLKKIIKYFVDNSQKYSQFFAEKKFNKILSYDCKSITEFKIYLEQYVTAIIANNNMSSSNRIRTEVINKRLNQTKKLDLLSKYRKKGLTLNKSAQNINFPNSQKKQNITIRSSSRLKDKYRYLELIYQQFKRQDYYEQQKTNFNFFNECKTNRLKRTIVNMNQTHDRSTQRANIVDSRRHTQQIELSNIQFIELTNKQKQQLDRIEEVQINQQTLQIREELNQHLQQKKLQEKSINDSDIIIKELKQYPEDNLEINKIDQIISKEKCENPIIINTVNIQESFRKIQKSIDKYNLIGQFVAKCNKIFDQLSKLHWKCPVYFLYKKFIYYRCTIIYTMSQNENIFDVQGWDQLIHSKEFKNSIQILKRQNELLIKSAKTMEDHIRQTNHSYYQKNLQHFEIIKIDKTFQKILFKSNYHLYKLFKNQILVSKNTKLLPYLVLYLNCILLCENADTIVEKIDYESDKLNLKDIYLSINRLQMQLELINNSFS